MYEQKFATPSERVLLLRSSRAAEACCRFITTHNVPARTVHLFLPDPRPAAQVYAVLFDSESFPVAKKFWQLTGLGISSRLAEHCIKIFDNASRLPSSSVEEAGMVGSDDISKIIIERLSNSASNAKTAIRHCIARFLAKDKSAETGQTLTENDVFLHPTGMTAIWSAHQLCMGALGERKSVCFGYAYLLTLYRICSPSCRFPYSDTLKVLETWGPGCHFFPGGQESCIDSLEGLLSSEQDLGPSKPPILALFTEFPSNPLLQSVNLSRLRNLANQYKFLIVIDDTIGNFINVQVMPFADIVVTSLTKVFSGYANVMGERYFFSFSEPLQVMRR